jgi:hypothetical protein
MTSAISWPQIVCSNSCLKNSIDFSLAVKIYLSFETNRYNIYYNCIKRYMDIGNF